MDQSTQLLLVEDDRLIGDGIRQALERDGYTVTWYRDGARARVVSPDSGFDICVLDLGLPTVDGLEILTGWRDRGVAFPVLILTARDTLKDKIAGFDLGGDDFLTKPFELEELLARLRALQRRHSGQRSITFGALRVDPEDRQAYLEGEPVTLSQREFELLRMLIEHPGQIRSRTQLELAVFGEDHDVSSNAIEVHIHNLRRKLGRNRVETVRGIGYRLRRGE